MISRDLEEIIEIKKKAIVYDEDKGGSSQTKTENKQKRQNGGQGGKGNKGNWCPSGGPKAKVQDITGDSHPKVSTGTIMVVTGGASTSGGKGSKPNKQGKGPKDKPRKKPPPACFLCGENHIVKNCPKWQAMLEATKKLGNKKPGPHNP